MDDTSKMSGMHGTSQSLDERRSITRWLRRSGDLFRQAPPFHELERQKRLAFFFTDMVKLHDIRMLKLCNDLGFELKSFQIPRCRVLMIPQRLNGHQPIERRLTSLIDDPHPANPQHPQCLIPREVTKWPVTHEFVSIHNCRRIDQ